MRKAFIAILLLLAGDRAGTAGPPNVVLILADDLGIGDLGSYNPASKIATPHMDRIAYEGTRFNDCHSPSSVCTPTRYGLLTGRYSWRSRMKSGVLRGYSRSLIEPGRPTIASLLKQAGYATGAFGKWHLGFQEHESGGTDETNPVDYTQPLNPGPTTVGFDRFFGIPASLDMPPYLFVVDDRPQEMPTGTIGDSGNTKRARGPFWRGGAISPSFKHADVLPAITDRAVQFLADRAKAAPMKPFFMYVALSGPHTPYVPTAEFAGKSKVGDYGDFVQQTDASIGRILAELDRLKVARNTLLICTSDNGAYWGADQIKEFDHRSNMNFRGQKSDVHEGGHRVPFLIRWPERVHPQATCNQVACLTDVIASVAEIVGIPLPRDAAEDSFSFLPALLGSLERSAQREFVIHHSGQGMFAIRSRRHKLIEGLGSGGFTPPQRVAAKPGEPAVQLYDMALDRGETRNLAAERPEIVRDLQTRLNTIRDAGHSRR